MENRRKLQREEQDPAMEDVISLILRGCSLARDLESNVKNFFSNNVPFFQPHFLAPSCDEILSIFSAAKDRLTGYERPPFTPLLPEEWFESTCSQAMELAQMQMMPPPPPPQPLPPVEDSGNVMGMGFGPSSSSSSKVRIRRKDNTEMRTVKVAALRVGNTELPPEDGFTWQKYGQKEIRGSRFPRVYLRCTHEKLYQCPAKKHVQRLDDDPHTFEIAYFGDHTCHMSATAPSGPSPPPLPDFAGEHMPLFPPPSTRRLSTEFAGLASGSDHGGPSAIPYGNDAGDHFPVLDMDDTMFNSGNGGSNSIDSILTELAGPASGSDHGGPSSIPYGNDAGDHFPVLDMADTIFNSGNGGSNRIESISTELAGPASGSDHGGPSAIPYGNDAGDQFPVLDMADTMFNSGNGGRNSIDSIFDAYVAEEHHHHKWE